MESLCRYLQDVHSRGHIVKKEGDVCRLDKRRVPSFGRKRVHPSLLLYRSGVKLNPVRD